MHHLSFLSVYLLLFMLELPLFIRAMSGLDSPIVTPDEMLGPIDGEGE